MRKFLKHSLILMLAGILIFSAIPMGGFPALSEFLSDLQIKAEASEVQTVDSSDVTLAGWFSNEAFGSVPSRFVTQQDLYLNFELYDTDSSMLLNSYGNYDYTVTMAIYRPDGSKQHEYTYNRMDMSWISVWLSQAGVWTAKITTSGDVNLEINLSVEVEYDAWLDPSHDSVNLSLSGENNFVLNCTASGAFPGRLGMAVSYDSSVISVVDKGWVENSEVFSIEFRGLKVGSTEIVFTLHEMYTSAEEEIASVSVPITVTSSSQGYTLTYRSPNGESVPSQQTGQYSYTISGTVPARFKYSFLGWSKSSTATYASYEPGDSISLTSDTSLYPVWQSAVNLSENTDYTTDIDFSFQCLYYKFTAPSDGTYVFESNSSSDSKIAVYSENGALLGEDDDTGSGNNFLLSMSLSESAVYYVKVFLYSSNTGSVTFSVVNNSAYTISFDANGGNGAPSTQESTGSFTIPSTVPTRMGYTFQGWTCQSGTYKPGETITVSSDLVLRANWRSALTVYANVQNSCTISFAGQEWYYVFTPNSSANYVIESTGSLDSQCYVYNSSGTQLAYDDDGSSSGNNFRLTQSFSAGNTYYIKIRAYDTRVGSTSFSIIPSAVHAPTASIYSTNNSSVSQTVTLEMSDNAGVSAYYWGTSGNPGSGAFTSISSTVSTQIRKTVTEPGTYYLIARDTEGNVSPAASVTFYKTYFDLSSGQEESFYYINTLGHAFSLPDIAYSDYTFYGWSLSSSASSVDYEAGYNYTVDDNRNFYGVFTSPDEKYTLSYDSNGGDVTPEAQSGSNSYTISLSIPEKFGYNFVGWSTQRNNYFSTYAPGDTITLSRDTTLYAMWESANYISNEAFYEADINHPYLEKYYIFSPYYSGEYTFLSSGPVDSNITVFNATGSDIGTDDDAGPGYNFRLTLNLTAGADYYIRIGAFSDNTGTISFRIEEGTDSAPVVEVRSSNDFDDEQTVGISVTDESGIVAYYWGINSSPSDYSYSDVSQSTEMNFEFTVSEAGTYYFYAKDSSGNISDAVEMTYFITTFNPNYQGASSFDILTQEGYGFELPEIDRSGYEFLGWSDTQTYYDSCYAPGSSYSPQRNITYYGQWSYVTLSRIEISSMPHKLTYRIGEDFDLDGLELRLVYSDGSVGYTDEWHSFSGFESSTAGICTVTVSYGGKSVSFNVNISSSAIFEPSYMIEGNNLYVYVFVRGYEDHYAGNFSALYDQEHLTFVSPVDCSYGEFAIFPGAYSYFIQYGPDHYCFTFNMTEPGYLPFGCYTTADSFGIEDFLVVSLKFTISENAPDVIPVTLNDISEEIESYTLYVERGSLLREMGDVDEDGTVSSADARIVLRASVGLEELSRWNLPYANADCDDSVSSADARLILRYSVGLEDLNGHNFELKNGDYMCSDCSVRFHLHIYEHHNCYESEKCSCGAENGNLAGHIFNWDTKKCISCNADLYDIADTAKTVISTLNRINTLRENAEAYYSKGDYGNSLVNSVNLASEYNDIAKLLKDEPDFVEVYNVFLEARRTVKSAYERMGDTITDPSSYRENSTIMLEAARKTKASDDKVYSALLNMLRPYEDLINIDGIFDNYIN